ncbi:MAG: M20/M25/M40 family metallo-hydrolase, partial [Cyanobacteria bacterium]|nr:M20/M25/M40 family metallo-hydrolase [Cyanobacteriota bacterium]
MKTMPLPLNIENVVNRFIEMVQIDSPSGDEGKMQAYLMEWCKAFDPKFAITYETDNGGNLIVDIPSSQCSHSQRLILSGHMDVVPPCLNVHPVIEGTGDDRVISSDNTTVLGADDKAGLTAIMEAVRVSLEENRPRPALRLLFTTREETYLGGAKDLSDAALQGNFAVTLDHTGVQGTIIHQAPSYFEWTVDCLGKSVHAGIMPEKGVNAIVFAS